MPMTNFFRVAVEGATCDGRVLERQHIIEMAEQYDPQVYGARVNLEHILGWSPNSDFRAYGDVAETKYEEIAEGQLKGKLALLVKVDATDELVELKKKRQKIYHSIEVHPSFADTGKAYLMGLACTDNPASLGTEMMKFCTQNANANPLAARHYAPECFFTETLESSLEFAQEQPPASDAGKNFFARVKEMLTGTRQHFDRENSDIRQAVELVAESQGELLDKVEKLNFALLENKQYREAMKTLQADFDQLKQQLSTQDASQYRRPEATGAEKTNAQLADC
ncbi:MAG: GPO family capsid scaffolding protein [Enterobacter sp.]|nr:MULTISPECIES: GPO family capsid scaffolding protein [Enterobacteriaceae]ELV1587278.1 GPO family capsid scaffolding protein [Escherichia coli]QLW23632.1 GPO family capsid scaffolding protein [Enterobacter cloacae]HAN2662278.1 GPO family capsid scaffolding protein [Escherichia coli O25b:H4-ST131]MCY9474471.1 GPO family capsid scaffolding protein [Escherichia coli]MDU2770899.1 GPO family capsid scaffolding protein [Enterobacter sp.]